jgi:hypothetical protein
MFAHPTTYGGARFRSRLEARWAAFFDLAGWRWEYEPLDLEGWSPDFALIGRDQTVLVEVKPIEWRPSWQAMFGEAESREDLEKVRRVTDREVLVLGAYPVLDTPTAPALGVLWGEDSQAYGAEAFDGATLWCGDASVLDFCAESGSYRYRISGSRDRDTHLTSVDPDAIARIWREAGARTQWLGK